MSDSLIETENLRVRIVADETPTEPYDDGGSPIVRLEHGYDRDGATDWRVEQITGVTSYVVPDRILDAIRAHLNERGAEYYEIDAELAPFGVTKVDVYTPRDGGAFITFDPSDWRELVGAPEGSISLEEWRAYWEGEVYGYVLEERATWTRDVPEESERFISDPDTMETWEVVESCWGFYGSEYVEEEARRVFAEACGERGHDSGDNPVDESGESTCTLCGAPVNADPDAS